MKKTLLLTLAMLGTAAFAQEHYSGISTSRRVGLLNANLNPAELTNMQGTYEVNIFNFSINAANNKMTFGDLVGGNDDFEEMLFAGNEPLNMRIDAEILGPAFAMKVNKWAFGISSAANVKASLVDINTTLGNAVTNGGVESISEVYEILDGDSQRATGVSWGEIGLSAARELFNNERHSVSAGITFNLLFPGTYANMSTSRFSGTITNNFGDVELTNAQAQVNFAYSGSLAGDFSDSGNFTEFFAGGLNGLSTDIGINYQWKAIDSTTYKINAGLAIKNLGSMTFKDDNNESTNYTLDVPEGQSLDLNQFEDAESIEEIEDILLASGYLARTGGARDFKVKLPAMLTAYADVNVYKKWFITGYVQQKLNEDGENDQIVVQNIVSFTPRYSTKFFEAYTPLSFNEVSDFTAGIGFRLGGFFMGSGSILSAALGDTNQADAYLGFRIGF
ncbi:hypothetical protein [Flavobacterium coralii]|uniref:hypothetical protein n=1 Tax=Flavobacterium coralii TaxID=2838017 RepID=UPI000C5D0EDF|nr:hypothetical protein [Flavobacterium sp.]|tara:strand:+ start:25953 stop:27296 length:1344 start_codon:yes stop_codon:yes gene_type:complete